MKAETETVTLTAMVACAGCDRRVLMSASGDWMTRVRKNYPKPGSTTFDLVCPACAVPQ